MVLGPSFDLSGNFGLLDYLGHQDLQFHPEEYGTLGVVRHSNSKTAGHRCCVGLMQFTPTFSVHGFRRTTLKISIHGEGKVCGSSLVKLRL